MKESDSTKGRVSQERPADRLGAAGTGVDVSSVALAAAVAPAAPASFGKADEGDGSRLIDLGDQIEALTRAATKPEVLHEQLVKQMPADQAAAFQQLLATLSNPDAALVDAIGPEALLATISDGQSPVVAADQLQDMIDSLTSRVDSLTSMFDSVDPGLSSAIAQEVANLSSTETRDVAITATEFTSNLSTELGRALGTENLDGLLGNTDVLDTGSLTDSLVDIIDTLPSLPIDSGSGLGGGLTDGLSDGLSDGLGGLIDNGTGLIENLIDPISDPVGGVTDVIDNTVDNTVDGVTDTVDNTVDGVTDTVDNTVDGVTDTIDNTVDGLTDAVDGLVDAIPDTGIDVIDNTIDQVGGVVTDVVDNTTGAVTDVVDNTTGAVTDVVDNTTGTVTDVVDVVTDVGGGLIGSLTQPLSNTDPTDGLDLGTLSNGISSAAGTGSDGGTPDLGLNLDKI